jgi:hypothetical protein
MMDMAIQTPIINVSNLLVVVLILITIGIVCGLPLFFVSSHTAKHRVRLG